MEIDVLPFGDVFRLIVFVDKGNSAQAFYDRLFTLLTIFSSGIFALVVALLTNWFTENLEYKKFGRQLNKEKIERVRALYEDALFILSNVIIQRGRGTQEQQTEFTRVESRLNLYSTNEIKDQFGKTFEIARQWAMFQKASEPKEMEGYVVYQSKQSSRAEDMKKKQKKCFLSTRVIF